MKWRYSCNQVSFISIKYNLLVILFNITQNDQSMEQMQTIEIEMNLKKNLTQRIHMIRMCMSTSQREIDKLFHWINKRSLQSLKTRNSQVFYPNYTRKPHKLNQRDAKSLAHTLTLLKDFVNSLDFMIP